MHHSTPTARTQASHQAPHHFAMTGRRTFHHIQHFLVRNVIWHVMRHVIAPFWCPDSHDLGRHCRVSRRTSSPSLRSELAGPQLRARKRVGVHGVQVVSGPRFPGHPPPDSEHMRIATYSASQLFECFCNRRRKSFRLKGPSPWTSDRQSLLALSVFNVFLLVFGKSRLLERLGHTW